MIISEKIINELRKYDLTLVIRPIKEEPNFIRITVRNDDYVLSRSLHADMYNIETSEILELIIKDFKQMLVN